MKKIRAAAFIPVFALLLAVFSSAATADAAEESSTSSVTMNPVTLVQHSSYESNLYFGVIHVESADSTIATATSDSMGHVVITGISSGATRIHYWFRSDAAAGWTQATVPVTVSGTASATSETAQTGGLVFSQTGVTLVKGGDYTASGILLNGKSVDAGSLLWVSSSDTVASVDPGTGKITAVGLGTAVIYAIDPATKCAAGINLTVD